MDKEHTLRERNRTGPRNKACSKAKIKRLSVINYELVSKISKQTSMKSWKVNLCTLSLRVTACCNWAINIGEWCLHHLVWR